MKNLSLFFALLCTTIIWAQAPEKMSYQAVVRDTNGALVSNQPIGMRISILQGSTTGTVMYREVQTPTSNANGLISLEIGVGTVVSGDFTTIDWGNQVYFIKTETDITGNTNYTITSTSQLLSVPYALHAKTAANVSGLEKITENGNTGWRLVGENPNNYGDIGNHAVDLSFSLSSSNLKGATGNYSTAMGYGTTASGDYSTAMGLFTTASGNRSTAMGDSTTASGNNSTAMGFSTTASGDRSTAMGKCTTATGDYSTAMGNYTTAESMNQTTLGQYNTIVSGTPNGYSSTSRLFVIGNGNSSNRSDAMVI